MARVSRQGRPRKGELGLPAWFRMDKYERVRNFTARQWYEQLAYRESLFLACDEMLAESNCAQALLPIFDFLGENPILFQKVDSLLLKKSISVEVQTKSEGAVINAVGDNFVYSLVKQYRHYTRGVAVLPLLVGDIQNIEPKSYGSDGTRGKIIFHDDGNVSSNEPSLNHFGCPIVAVDLTLSDELLIREFRNTLLNLRKNKKPLNAPFVKSSDFKRWYDSGALPYLDLLLWEKIGNKFRWATFINALSQVRSAPVSSESAAIKAAQSYASKLIDPQTIRILEIQATREGDKGAQKSGKFLIS